MRVFDGCTIDYDEAMNREREKKCATTKQILMASAKQEGD